MTATLPRRRFLAAAGGVFAFAARNGQDRLFAAPAAAGVAKRCLVLWMNGGPSQLETLDPKSGASTGGPTESIATAVPGLHLAQHLPQLAQRMDRVALLRNLTSNEGEHERAQYQMHTGYGLVPAFPRPSLGAMISHQTDATPFPRFVSFGSRAFGPAFLGPDHAPFAVREPGEALTLLRDLRRRGEQLRFLEELGGEFEKRHPSESIRQRDASLRRIESMLATPFVDALDVAREPERMRARYGHQPFGQQCLAARRLLESGVRFVEVQLDGWDTHNNNFDAVERLCGILDGPWSALLDDLAASGLLDETIVLWMGEFGRTPRINGRQGRDHFPRVTPVAVAGGGIRGGQSIGATNDTGTAIEGPSHSVADLFATILHAMGIAPDHEFRTAFDSPTPATDSGKRIEALAGR